MEWILDALANVMIEALNDMLIWTSNLITGFNLEVWDASSEFGKTFGVVSGFMHAIQVLAMFIVIMTTILKLYQSMGGPFTQSEEPGVIAIRSIGAGCGVILAYKIFAMITSAFNGIYQQFVTQYTGMSTEFNGINWKEFLSGETKNKLRELTPGRNNPVSGDQPLLTTTQTKDNAFNLFGGEHLIRDGMTDTTLGLMIIEVIIGCTLMICFFRLVLECYERYVLIGVMFYTAPLAFATLVSKQSQIFKNWCQMVVCQFILMCLNLFFLGGFIAAWYAIIARGINPEKGGGYLFATSTEYLTAMFIMIGWLLAGQKADEHLRSAGLSAAQTGSGIMGAMMGGAAMAAGAFRSINGAARTTARTAQKGIDFATGGKASKPANNGIFGTGRSERQLSDRKENGGSERTAKPLEQNGLPQPTEGKSGETLQSTAEVNKAIADQVANIGNGGNSKYGANFDAESAKVTGHETVPGGQGHRSIMDDGHGHQAYIYDNVADARMVHGSYTNKEGKDVPNYAEVKVGSSNGAIHFKLHTTEESSKA